MARFVVKLPCHGSAPCRGSSRKADRWQHFSAAGRGRAACVGSGRFTASLLARRLNNYDALKTRREGRARMTAAFAASVAVNMSSSSNSPLVTGVSDRSV